MYEFFQRLPVNLRGTMQFPEFLYVKNEFKEQIDKFQDYYHNHITRVNSNHILVKLLESIGIPYTDPRRHVDLVETRGYELSKTLGFTSPIGRGRISDKGHFYGKGAREVIMAINEPFDVEHAVKNWRTLEPIKVRYHSMTGLYLPLLDAETEWQRGDFAIISINIPMLSLQFKEWEKWMLGVYGKDKLGTGHFARMFPIANMAKTHLDIAIMNRIVHYAQDRPVARYEALHSFFTIDLDQKTDRILKQYAAWINNKRMNYHHVLNTLPAVSASNQLTNLLLPKVPPNRNIEWALNLSRLTYISFLLKSSRRNGNSADNDTNSDWRRSIVALYVEQTMRAVLHGYEYMSVMKYIENEIRAYLE